MYYAFQTKLENTFFNPELLKHFDEIDETDIQYFENIYYRVVLFKTAINEWRRNQQQAHQPTKKFNTNFFAHKISDEKIPKAVKLLNYFNYLISNDQIPNAEKKLFFNDVIITEALDIFYNTERPGAQLIDNENIVNLLYNCMSALSSDHQIVNLIIEHQLWLKSEFLATLSRNLYWLLDERSKANNDLENSLECYAMLIALHFLGIESHMLKSRLCVLIDTMVAAKTEPNSAALYIVDLDLQVNCESELLNRINERPTVLSDALEKVFNFFPDSIKNSILIKADQDQTDEWDEVRIDSNSEIAKFAHFIYMLKSINPALTFSEKIEDYLSNIIQTPNKACNLK